MWKAPLDVPPAACAALAATLSDDERERAARFHFELHRDRFVAGRAALRALLGAYLEIDPRMVAFDYGPYGKPALRGAGLSFNVSHSGPLALIALTRERAIGVDLERRTDTVDYLAIAQRYFTPAETADLESLPAEARQSGFLNCWTRKEALIKARGEGISLPLDRFAVSLKPEALPALLWTSDGPVETSRWDVRAIDAEPEYIAALVVERPCGPAIVGEWPGQPET